MSRYRAASQTHVIALFRRTQCFKEYFLIYFSTLALLLTACSTDESDSCRASNLNVTDPRSVFGARCSTLGDWSIGLDIVSNQEEFNLACTSAGESTLECQSSVPDLRATLTITDELLAHWTLTNGSAPLPVDEVALVLSGPDQSAQPGSPMAFSHGR